MLKNVYAFLFLVMFACSNIKAGKPEDFIKSCSNGNPVDPQLTMSYSAAGGFLTFIALKAIEKRILNLEDSKLLYALNLTISSAVPGLIFADVMDDGEINGSSLKNLANSVRSQKDAKKIYNLLIEKLGVVNLITALAGALLADHVGVVK